MRPVVFAPARPVDTDNMPWIPAGPGEAFRAAAFGCGRLLELMRHTGI